MFWKVLVAIVVILFPALYSRTITFDDLHRLKNAPKISESTVGFHFLIFSVLTWAFCYPMQEMRSAGITIENVFVHFIGVASPDFVFYECRRVVFRRAFLGILPFVFFVVEYILDSFSASPFSVNPSHILNHLANISVLLLIGTCTYYYYNSMTQYENMEAISRLLKAGHGPHMTELNRRISLEVLNPQTFTHIISSTKNVVVTENWVIYATAFNISIVPIEDCTFHVTDTEDIIMNAWSPEGAVQMLTILIKVPSQKYKDISFKIHNICLLDLQNAIVQRINIPSSLTLKASTVDRFAMMFAAEAARNPPYYVTREQYEALDKCLACAEVKANMKLIKRCDYDNLDDDLDIDDEEEGGDRELQCRVCNCSPMWCVNCMGKVFAAKQNINRVGTWMLKKAPCPTCRRPFCVLDIALVKVE